MAGSRPKIHLKVIKSPSDQIKACIIIARCKLNTLTQLLFSVLTKTQSLVKMIRVFAYLLSWC